MKKKLFSLLTALVLCLLCAVPAFAEMPLVMDTYELFKPEATAELEQKAQDASAGHGVNVYLLTVSDIGGQNVREFAKDWYRDYDLGYGEGKSGILFLIALDSRDYVTITYGGGVTAFTDYRIAQIEDKIVPMLSDGSYYKASDTYIEMCADTLDFYADKGAPLDSGNDPAKGWIKWVFVFVIPLAVASIVCGIFQHRQRSQQSLTLFGVCLHQHCIICQPAADIASRFCGIDTEYRAEAGFTGLAAGHGHYHAVFPTVLIVGIYRFRQIHAVQDLEACRITGTHAEDHKVLALSTNIIDFDLLAVDLEVDHVFYLREEKVLGTADSVDCLCSILCFRCPDAVLYTAFFIGAVSNRQIEFLCFCDGSEQSVQIFSRYFFHHLLPPL